MWIRFAVIVLPDVAEPKTHTPGPVLLAIVLPLSRVPVVSAMMTPIAFGSDSPPSRPGPKPTSLSSTTLSAAACQMPMPEYGPPVPKPLPPITFRRITLPAEPKSASTP